MAEITRTNLEEYQRFGLKEIGKAAAFDGTSSVILNNNTASDAIKGGFPQSMGGWFKCTTYPPALGYLLMSTGDWSSIVYAGLNLSLGSNNDVAFEIGVGAGTSSASRTSHGATIKKKIIVNEWMHIAVVATDKNTIAIYFNGVLQTNNAQSGTGGGVGYGSLPARFGRGQNDVRRAPFVGQMDQLFLYQGIATQQDILTIMNMGRGYVDDEDLVEIFWHDFEDNTNDSNDNSFDGTPTNITYSSATPFNKVRSDSLIR